MDILFVIFWILGVTEKILSICRLPRYLTKPRQRRNEWDMAGSDGISNENNIEKGPFPRKLPERSFF